MEIKVIHTFVDPETNERSDQPLPTHINRIVAALLKEAKEEQDEQRKAG
jgi:hypothetical protein